MRYFVWPESSGELGDKKVCDDHTLRNLIFAWKYVTRVGVGLCHRAVSVMVGFWGEEDEACTH